MTTRIKDLPDDAAPGSTDRIPIDGTTTRSSTITNLSAKIASLLNSAVAVLTNKSISGATNTLTNIGGTSIRMGSDAQGDVLYFNGTDYARLAAGASGRFLKTLGAGANPAWAAVPGGGDMLAANNLSDLVSASSARTNLGVRDRLTATRDYYVRTDGSDSNTGLVNNAGGAWLTLQKAWDYIQANVDVAGQQLNINIGAGTFAAGVKCEGNVPGVSTLKPIKFVGAGSASTAIVATGDVAFKAYNGAAIGISSLSVAGNYGLICANGGYIVAVSDILFSTCTIAQLTAIYGGTIEFSGNWSINANCPNFAIAESNGIIVAQNLTMTLTGGPIFSSGLLYSRSGGVCIFYSITVVGAPSTGSKKYDAVSNGVVDTGGGTWTIPGSVAGTTSTGGQFT